MNTGKGFQARGRPFASRSRLPRDLARQGIPVADLLPTVAPPEEGYHANRVRELLASTQARVAVLDDDPTGTQSVRGIPVLGSAADDDLRWAVEQSPPAFFILTNTRSLDEARAAALQYDIASRLHHLTAADPRPLIVVSRSDSTLRGHFPAEPDALQRARTEVIGRGYDALLLCPAYPEAGRVTVDDVHWAVSDGLAVPVGETEFARDASFGYRASDLRAWVEEKTRGRIRADEVASVSLEALRRGGPEQVAETLGNVRPGGVVVANALVHADLEALAGGVLLATSRGQAVLCRTAPSFVRALIGQGASAPLSASDLYPRPAASAHGLVVVGSHVGLTGQQVDTLIAGGGVHVVHLDVATCLRPGARDAHLASVIAETVEGLSRADVLLMTSRSVIHSADPGHALLIARTVSSAVVDVVRAVVAAVTPRFVVSKGGITSHDLATRALGMRRAVVVGQMLPGMVSVWRDVASGPGTPPFVVFAGNVGAARTLADVVQTLHRVPDGVVTGEARMEEGVER